MSKAWISVGGLLAGGAAFIAFNVLSGAGLRRARVDLTEGSLYTLSDGSRKIARKPDEPVKLTLYFSEGQTAGLPAQFKSYGNRVKEVLAEYARASGGKVKLEVISPDPFSPEEDKAVQAGLVGVPTGNTAGDRFYFGLVGASSTDKQEVIPFFRPDREEFLEYELTRMIYLLSDPAKKTVGIMSWLPIEGVQDNPMMRGQDTPPWQIVRQVKELFEVKSIAKDVAGIPSDVQVLLIVHPKNVPDPTLYAIDQFILKGGRALIFVDPLCEADVPPGINPMQAMNLPKNSDLKKLFAAWGMEMVESKFAADRPSALRVNVGSQGRPEAVDFIAWLSLGDKNLDADDAVTGQLKSINVATSGVLRKTQASTLDLHPLLETSADSEMMDTQLVSFVPDPKKLMADFKPGGQKLTLAARIGGKVKSAFPDGKPGAPPQPAEGNQPPAPAGAHLAESKETVNVIVVADCDMLTDRFWINEIRFDQGGPVLGYNKLADNGDLVIGALDNLTGSSDLISVRARGKFQRPFTLVKKIQQDAEKEYLAREQELQTRLRETETKIGELQRQRPDAAGAGAASILLTPEQKAEIEKFRADQVTIRNDLRKVQHSLRKDVESLGTRLKFINMGLMPVLIGAAAVGLSVWRVRRRRTDRSAQTALN